MGTTEPLLLIAFNRPDHFEQLIERLRETRPQRIFVAIDGPRPGHATDADRVQRTRDLVRRDRLDRRRAARCSRSRTSAAVRE